MALPIMFLSGVFFPTDALPTILKAAVKFLPLTPLIEAMPRVSVESASIAAAGLEMALLAIWVLVSFAIATRYFRFSEA